MRTLAIFDCGEVSVANVVATSKIARFCVCRRHPRSKSCLGQDEQQHEVRQVEESVVQDRAPEASGLLVEPALGESEEEKGDERRVRPGLGEIVRGGEESG